MNPAVEYSLRMLAGAGILFLGMFVGVILVLWVDAAQRRRKQGRRDEP